jgi:hypothetical protein
LRTGAIGADIEDRGRGGAAFGRENFALLPCLSFRPDALHHALDLAGGNFDAAGFGQMVLGFLKAGFISSLQADQSRQRGSVGPFQA